MPGVKKSNQKKRHPGERALRVRERVTGFFDSTSCAGEKLAGIRASHPAGFPSPVRRALRGPGLRARAARGARTSRCRLALVEQQHRRAICFRSSLFALRLLLFALRSSSSARIARKGSPYAVSERGTKRPAGESAWMPIPFRQGRKPCRKARLPLTPRRAPPGEHRIWGALSLGYFSLGTQRKVTRPSADGRNARRAGEQPDGNA